MPLARSQSCCPWQWSQTPTFASADRRRGVATQTPRVAWSVALASSGENDFRRDAFTLNGTFALSSCLCRRCHFSRILRYFLLQAICICMVCSWLGLGRCSVMRGRALSNRRLRTTRRHKALGYL